jgi:hypothetical protein
MLSIKYNSLTGEALATAPPTSKYVYWEYPLPGTQVGVRVWGIKHEGLGFRF